jgi:acetoin utilization deacetylase AcuC-like enzyme
MLSLFDPAQYKHEPRFFLTAGTMRQNTEVADRARVLKAALRQQGHALKTPESYGMAPVAAVHRPDYLHFLKNIYQRWQRLEGASEEVIPNVHPGRPAGGYPEAAVGQAGWHMADTACPIGPDTWESALASANTAVAAAQHVLDGRQSVYALCRPPGHHAYADMAGGFCYLNNTAIAAQYLRRRIQRVAILDVDLHHGNGTQSIFYQRADVLTVSLHADPVCFYPFFWGYSQERGAGPGMGCNWNFPLLRGTQDAEYLSTLQQALERIGTFCPDALVVALGLDAFEGDPLAYLAISTPGFGRIGAAIAAMKLPTVLVQEGGYLSQALGDNLKSFLDGFEKS